jgi:BASS family bile acid:Na+ symporter
MCLGDVAVFRKQDLLLLLISYATMALGVFLPRLAGPLAHAPTGLVMFLLFLSFLAIDVRRLVLQAVTTPRFMARLLVTKAVLLPVAVFGLFHLVWPRYELAALLVAGASTAVLAPFFADLFEADLMLTAAAVILSSLLLPFTLPPLVGWLSGQTFHVAVLPMVRMLALMIFVPAVAGRASRCRLPRLTDWLLTHSYALSLLAVGVTNVAVFSRYSRFFLQQPERALEAVAAACLMVAAVLAAGPWLFRGQARSRRATSLVCLVFPNSILILAFSCRFFGPLEATFAATYSVPFFLQVLLLRRVIGADKASGPVR